MANRPWRLPISEVRALRLLEHLADANTTWVEDLNGLGIDRDDIAALLRDCERAGNVELEPRHTMTLAQAYPGARLTSTGTRYVEQIRDQRSDPGERARATRSEILLWLYGTDDHFPVTTNFLGHRQTYFGVPFSEKDTLAAAKHLLELGLIQGPTSWQSQGAPLRIQITTKGRTVVEEHDADPARASQQHNLAATIYNQHIYKSTGSIAQGERAIAITHQGLKPGDLQLLREIFTSGLSTLDPLDRQDVQQAVDDLLAELEGESVNVEQVKRRVGSLERLASHIGNAALKAAASEGGKRALELLVSSF